MPERQTRHHRQSPWQDNHPPDTLPPIRHVTVGHGVRWIGEGWALFVRRPGLWLITALLQTLLILLVMGIAGDLLQSQEQLDELYERLEVLLSRIEHRTKCCP